MFEIKFTVTRFNDEDVIATSGLVSFKDGGIYAFAGVNDGIKNNITFNGVLLKDITTIDDSDQFCDPTGKRFGDWSQLKADDRNGDPKKWKNWNGSFKWDDTTGKFIKQ